MFAVRILDSGMGLPARGALVRYRTASGWEQLGLREAGPRTDQLR